jgi:hypothetical protein
MAKLSAAQRKNVPASKTGLPGKRTKKGGAVTGSFPMPDKAHAVAAERLVGRSVKAGNTTPAQAATVRAKAKRMLGKSKSK